MELTQLRAFRTVAETQSFTRAAERLNLTQSAVSRQIGALEHELGEPLFVRGRRVVRLTGFGERTLSQVSRILDDLDGLAGQGSAASHGADRPGPRRRRDPGVRLPVRAAVPVVHPRAPGHPAVVPHHAEHRPDAGRHPRRRRRRRLRLAAGGRAVAARDAAVRGSAVAGDRRRAPARHGAVGRAPPRLRASASSCSSAAPRSVPPPTPSSTRPRWCRRRCSSRTTRSSSS